MNDNDDLLATLALDAREWRGVEQLRNALSDFEPLAKRVQLGPIIADRLVGYGLAEKRELVHPERYSPGIGYRLTDLGWRFVERGRWPKS